MVTDNSIDTSDCMPENPIDDVADTASGPNQADLAQAASSRPANTTDAASTADTTDPTDTVDARDAVYATEENEALDPEDGAEGGDDDNEKHGIGDPKLALLKLIDLATKYPEIGPPLAELAFKIGQTELGHRVVRMALDSEQGPGLEYYFVVAQAARRQRRFAEARKHAIEAIEAFDRTSDDALEEDDAERMLHLIRLGFSTLLFDEKDPNGDPEWVQALDAWLPKLAPRLDDSAFYHTLVAQTKWYDDTSASEHSWQRAVALDTTESTWNARGTWYKDAAGDMGKAEQAYREGLQVCATSPLLLHNLGQLLVDKAERSDVDVEQARKALNEAEQHLRGALREQSPKGFRRHVHSTIDRLMSLRSSLPPKGTRSARTSEPEPTRQPEVGEVFEATVRSITAFGAFVALPECGTALLHKSEMAHHFVRDPSEEVSIGDSVRVKVLEVGEKDGKLRVAVSRKVLLDAPPTAPHQDTNPAQPPPIQPNAAPADRSADKLDNEPDGNKRPHQSHQHRDRPDQRGQPRGQERRHERSKGQQDRSKQRSRDNDKLASLGEMLLAKIQKQKEDKH